MKSPNPKDIQSIIIMIEGSKFSLLMQTCKVTVDEIACPVTISDSILVVMSAVLCSMHNV